MVRAKCSELSTDAQVDNVVLFLGRESINIVQAKDVLELKQCGVTRSCITNARSNPFNCECFEKCEGLGEVLKLFI